MSAESLSLKFGMVKAWDIKRPETLALVESCMRATNDQKQKELLCKLIDAVDCEEIHLYWSNETVSKQKAKNYVLNYDRCYLVGGRVFKSSECQ